MGEVGHSVTDPQKIILVRDQMNTKMVYPIH